MRVLILQNCEYETLGTYEGSLVDSGMTCDVVHTCQESLPDPQNYSMLLIGGTPDPAYDRSQVPYLAQVYETLTNAVNAGSGRPADAKFSDPDRNGSSPFPMIDILTNHIFKS
jgi:hypothetical protein